MDEARPVRLGRFFFVALSALALLLLIAVSIRVISTHSPDQPQFIDSYEISVVSPNTQNVQDGPRLKAMDIEVAKANPEPSPAIIPDSSWPDQRALATSACRLTVKVWVANEDLLTTTREQILGFKESNMGSLPICFQSPELATALNQLCDSNSKKPIQCDIRALADIHQASFTLENPTLPFSHLLVVVEQGKANTRGGLMMLDANDELKVLQHELAHWLGYVDEYRVSPSQQKKLCQDGPIKWLGPNVLSAPASMPLRQVEAVAERPLYPTQTCDGSERQAYKAASSAGFMAYLDYKISDKEVAAMAQHLTNFRPIPVAMNFAQAFAVEDHDVLSSEEEASFDLRYEFWLKQAARQASPDAHIRLALWYLKRDNLSLVRQHLLKAAELGETQAQIILGHANLEGLWWPKESELSAYWYKKAAEQNDASGLYHYGRCLELGLGCEKSAEKANDYYRRAARLGQASARARLSQLPVASIRP